MITVLTGLVAGGLHVVSGPDHIAALAPIAVNRPQRAIRLGAIWGLGHGMGVAVLGGLGIWAKAWVDVQVISGFSELMVGVLLIGMGLWAFRVASRFTLHSHDHEHDAEGGHAHVHVHMGMEAHDAASHAHHERAAFGVGVLHGAAGAGHLFGVLPSLALPTQQAAIYLAAYFVSAVASMTLVGAILGRIAGSHRTRRLQRLMQICGLVALSVGVFWLSQGLPT